MSHESEVGAREQGRNAALSGRPIFANPHMGGEAEAWFAGYREVPEALRGSQPAPASKRLARKKTRSGFRHLSLRGSTPFAEAIHAEVADAETHTPRPWVGL